MEALYFKGVGIQCFFISEGKGDGRE